MQTIEEPTINPFADEMPIETSTETASAGSAIAEYSPTALALDRLRARYLGVLYEVTTPEGMDDAKAARKEIAAHRLRLEKVRKEIKAPALAKCQLIDSEAKRIQEQIAALEDPIARQIQTEENRIEQERIETEQAEQRRVADIMAKIEELRRLPIALAGAPSDEIIARRAELSVTRSDESGTWLVQFQEYWSAAEQARDATIIALADLYAQRVNTERYEARIQADREELAKLRAEKEANSIEAVNAELCRHTETPLLLDSVQENAVNSYYREKIAELCEDEGVRAFRLELEAYRAEQDAVTATVKLHDLLNDWATTCADLRDARYNLNMAQSELATSNH